MAAAGIGVPFLVMNAHRALDQAAPATTTAGTLLAIAALALPAAIGFPFLVDRRPGSMLLPAAIGGMFGGVWAIASFQDYGPALGGLGLIFLFLYGGIVAGIGLLIAAIFGASHPSGPRPAMAVACGWAIAWGFCALAMLVTLQHQAAEAAFANRPHSSPGVGPLLAVGLLVAAAWRRR